MKPKLKSRVAILAQPAVDKAVDEYMHRNDPEFYHKRFPEGQCPQCLSPMEKMREQLAESLDVEDLRENIRILMEEE